MNKLIEWAQKTWRKIVSNRVCRLACIATGVVVSLWLFNAAVFYCISSLDNRSHQALGTFGDSFGAANALFSGLAFVGVIVAIVMQGNELKLQRRELRLSRTQLRLTRDELKGQKEQMTEQSKLMAKQAFENTFFKMLDSFDKLRDQTRVVHNSMKKRGEFGPVAQGEAAFSEVASQLEELGCPASQLDQSRGNYVAFYVQPHITPILGPYFRSLYQLLSLVDEADIDNRKHYSGIVRARLTTSELTLLAFNAISSYGDPKMLRLVVHFRMLKHLDHGPLSELAKQISSVDPVSFENCDGHPTGLPK